MDKKNTINLKEKNVEELAQKIKKSRTLMIASIKNLPSKQFQDIKKSIRKDAYVRVAKKNIMIRSLEKSNIIGLNDYIVSDCILIISDLESYDLAAKLAKKKTPVFAKAGQIALEDIEIKDGPTSLVPGPAISELGALGLQVSVENGKISIRKSKVVIKKGQKIKENEASILQKLNIMPFNVGLNVNASYDIHNNKIYTELKIDPEGYARELKEAASKSLGFAQKILYVCKDTINYLLSKANSHANALSKYENIIGENKNE
ncbi:MAG: 50S ribosomal protein L10 [Nanoarchaeota archaeon]